MSTTRAKISILGLYGWDDTIFNDMTVPTGVTRDDVVNEILFQCAELSLLYGDWGFMKKAIKHWSIKELPVWQELYDTTQYVYNPIWNKDGTIKERYTDTKQSSNESSGTSSAKSADAGQGSTVGKVSAFNASDFQNKDLSETATASQGERSTESENKGSAAEVVSHEYERLEQGNIGLTTTQSLIREQRDVVQFNIIDYIAKSFKRRFCLMIY